MTATDTFEVKLVVVGDAGVGKTVLILRMYSDLSLEENLAIGLPCAEPAKDITPTPRQTPHKTPQRRYPKLPTHQKRPLPKTFKKHTYV